MKRTCLIASSLLFGAAGCLESTAPDLTSTGDVPSFAEYLATVYQEPDTGLYIVDGDVPIRSLDELRAYHAQISTGQAGRSQSPSPG